MIITKVKTSIASCIIKSKVPVLQISAILGDISDSLKNDISKDISEFGIKLINFYVNSINIPENDPAVIKLRDALSKKAEMDIIGFTYQQERSFNVLQGAADNTGSSQSGIMGAGIGLGMGMGLGAPMGGMMGQIGQNLQTSGNIICPACNTKNPDNGKFCLFCGKSLTPCQINTQSNDYIECDKCKAKYNTGTKFCPNCGDAYNACKKCNADNPEGAENCIKCGALMSCKCPFCGKEIDMQMKFCSECGKELLNKCKCGKSLAINTKFCPDCGAIQKETKGE